jgi:hypothetical protein
MKIAPQYRVLRLDGRENRPPNGPGRIQPMDRSEPVRSFAEFCTENPKNREGPRSSNRYLAALRMNQPHVGPGRHSGPAACDRMTCQHPSWIFAYLRAESVDNSATSPTDRTPWISPGLRAELCLFDCGPSGSGLETAIACEKNLN